MHIPDWVSVAWHQSLNCSDFEHAHTRGCISNDRSGTDCTLTYKMLWCIWIHLPRVFLHWTFIEYYSYISPHNFRWRRKLLCNIYVHRVSAYIEDVTCVHCQLAVNVCGSCFCYWTLTITTCVTTKWNVGRLRMLLLLYAIIPFLHTWSSLLQRELWTPNNGHKATINKIHVSDQSITLQP